MVAAGSVKATRLVLRAPKGSLDGFRRKQHNARKREWERSLLNRGNISTLPPHAGLTDSRPERGVSFGGLHAALRPDLQ